MEYFDYERAAREAGLTDEELRRLCELVRQDFPDDQMMFELHVLKACNSIRNGVASKEEVLGVRPPSA